MMPALPPAITVVIPCFRQARFLPEAIESALGQTRSVEVIVVDDGSPDDTADVARRYAVRLVRQENQGLTGARNAGLAASSSQFIAFLDADDRLLPTAVEAGLATLEREPDAVMTAGRCRLIDEDGRPLDRQGPRPCPGGDHYEHLLRHNHIWPPAVALFRREALAAAGGWGGGRRRAEDVELYLRLARSHPIRCHPDVIVEYRQHPAGLSSDRGEMLAALSEILTEQKPFVAANPRYLAALREAERVWPVHYGDLLVDDVRADLKARRWQGAVRGIGSLMRYYPRGAADVVSGIVRRIARGRGTRA